MEQAIKSYKVIHKDHIGATLVLRYSDGDISIEFVPWSDFKEVCTTYDREMYSNKKKRED